MRKLLLASLLLCMGSAMAQSNGYVVDSRGNVVKSGTSLCVHTGYWTPSDSTPGCDSTITVAAPVAPVLVPVLSSGAPVTPVMAETTRTVDVVIPAHVLFSFNKAVLSVQGKTALRMALKDHSMEAIRSIKIVGHTDRLGSDKYNLKLSQRRANAVAAFLLSSGIQAGVVKAEGHGKAEPVTQKSDCAAKKGSSLRSCYAPDRRVEVSFEIAQ